jgi:tetratricopeptide (TPR) repeat protein
MIAVMGKLWQISIWLCVALCLMAAPTASAAELDTQQRAARIDALFAELKTTKDQTRGQAATAEIWQHWMKSGRNDIDALTEQAVGFMAADALPSARSILDKVVAQAPDYAEGWNKRATVLYMLGEHDLSLADIDKVLALEPRHFGALAGQGLIHIAAERWKQALASMRRAVAVNPFLAERDTLIPALERKVEGVPL